MEGLSGSENTIRASDAGATFPTHGSSQTNTPAATPMTTTAAAVGSAQRHSLADLSASPGSTTLPGASGSKRTR